MTACADESVLDCYRLTIYSGGETQADKQQDVCLIRAGQWSKLLTMYQPLSTALIAIPCYCSA